MKTAELAFSLIACLVPPARGQDGSAATGNVCIDCHKSLEGRLASVVGEWETSSHAKFGVTCDGCHNGNPKDRQFAKGPSTDFKGSPRLRSVPYFCGKCHEGIKEKHMGSPHGELGLPNCVSCHGSHTITTPSPMEIITEEACSKCHPFEPASKALASLGKAHGILAELDLRPKELLHIPGIEDRIAEVQKSMGLDRAGVVKTFHSFRIGDIESIGMNVDRLKKLLDRLREREVRRQEKLAREEPFIIGFMVFLVFASFCGLLVYHRPNGAKAGSSIA